MVFNRKRMIKTACFALAFAILTGIPTAAKRSAYREETAEATVAAAEPVAEAAGVVATEQTDRFTAVRRAASSGAMIIGYFKEGQMVKVLKTGEAYSKVDGYGFDGYVCKCQLVEDRAGTYRVQCNADCKDTVEKTSVQQNTVDELVEQMLELADQQLGVHYVRGGSSHRGFDCSGFTSFIYRNIGITLGGACSNQIGVGTIVSKEDLQPGDLIFFRANNTIASHVALYVGDNQIIHASTSGIRYADLDSRYCSRYYLCARRILNPITTGIDVAPSTTAVNLEDMLHK